MMWGQYLKKYNGMHTVLLVLYMIVLATKTTQVNSARVYEIYIYIYVFLYQSMIVYSLHFI